MTTRKPYTPKKPPKLKRYFVYGKVVGSKYLGYVDARTKAEARKLVEQDKNAHCSFDVSLCHQCSDQCENAFIEDFELEMHKGDEP